MASGENGDRITYSGVVELKYELYSIVKKLGEMMNFLEINVLDNSMHSKPL